MDDLRITADFLLTAQELQILTARSSGPGGQNVNKVNSKVTLKWNPGRSENFSTAWQKRFSVANRNRINREGEIVLHSDRYRDQKKNLQDVRQRLVKLLLESQHPPKRRRATKPTKGSQRRRLQNKREQSEKKALRRSKPTGD